MHSNEPNRRLDPVDSLGLGDPATLLGSTPQSDEQLRRVDRQAGDILLRFIGHGLTDAENLIDRASSRLPPDGSSSDLGGTL